MLDIMALNVKDRGFGYWLAEKRLYDKGDCKDGHVLNTSQEDKGETNCRS